MKKKIEIEQMNLYYGDFHALKNVNLNIYEYEYETYSTNGKGNHCDGNS